jgi:RimJ/RimL family protein N-acetyltransferase
MPVEWIRLELDLRTFDAEPFVDRAHRCRQAGIEFTTMKALGDTEVHRRTLFELNRSCSADIPERGAFYTWDAYVAERLDILGYHPGGVVLALDRGEWVGMCAVTVRPERGDAYNEMTGVVRSHRQRGIALAMKLLAMDFVRSQGQAWVRTQHHPDNTAAITMNRRLGFTDITSGPTPDSA